MDFLDKYAKLMAEGFQDDPGIQVQFRKIEHGRELFELNCKCEIEAFQKLGCVTTYGDGEGMSIGYFTDDVTPQMIAQNLQHSSHYLLESPYVQELSVLLENAAQVAEIVKPDWYVQFIENSSVYVLQVIVVSQAMRGKGVFRKLMAPILESAEERNVPVVLQTHVHENAAKYEHLGFRLVEKMTSDELGLSCYNMMKD